MQRVTRYTSADGIVYDTPVEARWRDEILAIQKWEVTCEVEHMPVENITCLLENITSLVQTLCEIEVRRVAFHKEYNNENH